MVFKNKKLVFFVSAGIISVFIALLSWKLLPGITFFGFQKQETKGAKSCGFLDSVDYYYYLDTEKLWKQNNKVGLYIYAEDRDFFEIAQNLVNSNGGEWGYVLIPYNVKDYDYDKWDRVFNQLRTKKLIPIIQLWDIDIDQYEVQTKKAAEFLNSFLWPVKEWYISAYNEPNDKKFWYGKTNPEEYAEILDFTIKTFKNQNENFFIINGAFNITAPSDENHMDAFEFMKKMDEKVPGIFSKLDGWASHSYPQPNFSGNPEGTGRWSIKAYEEELKFLKNNLGVEKDLPVFITETGWAHAEGETYNPEFLGVEVISEYYKEAYEKVWLPDERVRAVTPFTIWYEPPFDHFSWINEEKIPYMQYEAVKSIKKVKGMPPILQKDTLDIGSCSEESPFKIL